MATYFNFRYIQHKNLSLYSESFGDIKTPAILLVSGAGTPARFWTDKFCSQLEKAGYCVIRYDHRDTGLSSGTDFKINPYTLDDLTQDVIAILNAYSIKKAHIVGHSMGGTIALRLALDYSNRCNSITTISTVSSGSALQQDLLPVEQKILNRTWKIMLANKPTEIFEESKNRFLNIYRHLNGTMEFDTDMALNYTKDLYERSNHLIQLAYNHLTAIEASQNRTSNLPSISVPSTIIHGQFNNLVFVKQAYLISNLIPKAQLKIIPSMGHMIFNPELETKIANIILSAIQNSQNQSKDSLNLKSAQKPEKQF